MTLDELPVVGGILWLIANQFQNPDGYKYAVSSINEDHGWQAHHRASGLVQLVLDGVVNTMTRGKSPRCASSAISILPHRSLHLPKGMLTIECPHLAILRVSLC